MKINLLAAGVLAAAVAMPIGAFAQQGEPPATRSHSQTMPNEGRLQQHWAKRMRKLNLSNDQQQRIQSIIHDYSQSHPEGSPRGHGAMRELRQQVMGTLTPDQQNEFRQQMRAHRGKGHKDQTQGQYQQGGPDQYQQQGMPDQQYPQYQQGGPQQYQQGGPPPQYQQGGPPPQYQQGGPPPQYQQGGPPPQYQQGGPPPQYQQGPPPDAQDDDQGQPPA